MPLSPNMRGAAFMAVSMAGFTANDVLTKAVSAEMNMGQVMLLRGVFATLIIGAIAAQRGALRDLAWSPGQDVEVEGVAHLAILSSPRVAEHVADFLLAPDREPDRERTT